MTSCTSKWGDFRWYLSFYIHEISHQAVAFRFYICCNFWNSEHSRCGTVKTIVSYISWGRLPLHPPCTGEKKSIATGRCDIFGWKFISSAWNKLLPENVASSQLAAPGSPRMVENVKMTSATHDYWKPMNSTLLVVGCWCITVWCFFLLFSLPMWRFLITGAGFNREIKVWCTVTWMCLQTIR